MDKPAASLILIAAGAALAFWYYRLERPERAELLAGLTGRVKTAAPPEGGASKKTQEGPYVGAPRPGPPPAATEDWLTRQQQKFNRVLEDVTGMFERLGQKPPYEIKPFPVPRR